MPRNPDAKDALLGRQRRRTAVGGGIAIVILVIMSVVGASANDSWMAEITLQLYLPVLFVFGVGGSVAAWNAYWNDGILMSWLLVFCLVVPWEWYATGGGYGRSLGVVISITLALFVGTLGYVIGRRLRGFGTRDTWDDPSSRLLRLLLGTNYTRTIWWGVFACGMFIVWGGLSSLVFLRGSDPGLLGVIFVPTIIVYQPDLLSTVETAVGIGVFLSWIAVAAWPAYRRDGLLVSWGLLFAPLFGTTLAYTVAMEETLLSPLVLIAFALLIVLGHVVVFGTVGFLLGTALRSVIGDRRDGRSEVDREMLSE